MAPAPEKEPQRKKTQQSQQPQKQQRQQQRKQRKENAKRNIKKRKALKPCTKLKAKNSLVHAQLVSAVVQATSWQIITADTLAVTAVLLASSRNKQF